MSLLNSTIRHNVPSVGEVSLEIQCTANGVYQVELSHQFHMVQTETNYEKLIKPFIR